MSVSTARFDYIIIGAGSAGCVMANRLSAKNGVRVLLLEAGPPDNSIILKMPAAMGLPLETDRFNWKYLTQAEAGLGNRISTQHRGRVLGGSSSINGMIFNRGNPRDFERWAANGLDQWSYAHCLPYFRKLENFDGGADTYRGHTGPLSIQRCRAENPLYHAFLRAGEQWGLEMTPDQNGMRQEGVHLAQVTIKNGVRQNTATAYLRPTANRSNLSIITNGFVQKLLSDGNRITGVVYDVKGVHHHAKAEREVILCAGAIASPQLMMLSGIGDADALREHQVPVIQHLPGVGQNLQDHIGVPVQFSTNRSVSPTRQLSQIGRIWTGMRWVLSRKGLGASNFFEVGAFFKSSDQQDGPNLQHEFFPMIGMYHQGKAQALEGFQYFTSIMHPKSRGSVKLKSANPKDPPLLRFNYLSQKEDLHTLAIGIKKTREMVRQSAWNELRNMEVSPGPDIDDDKQLEGWIRTYADSGYHPVSTCRMGDDPMAVTDSQGQVHGVEGLRVVDASIMPDLPTGNTHAATVMLAEKIADTMLGSVLPPIHADFS